LSFVRLATFLFFFCLFLYFLWSPYGIGQTIIFLPCGFFFYLSIYLFFFSSPNSQPSQIGCLPYFHIWCGLSANLRCRSETCCTRLAENTGRKKVAKNRHMGSIAQLCWAISSQLRHLSTIGKKLLSSNMSSTCPHNMVNFGPLTAEIGSGVWGTPAYFIFLWVGVGSRCSVSALDLGAPSCGSAAAAGR